MRPGPCGWGVVLILCGLWGAGAGCTPGAVPCTGWQGWQRDTVFHAQFFQLWHGEGGRMLLTFGPGGTADTTGVFVVGKVAEGGAAPHGAVVLERPLARVALWSTTHASFLSALGRAEAVVGCAYTKRLRDPQVAAMARAGKVAEIAMADGLDRERMLRLAPEALFTYPYGTEGKSDALGKLPVVPIAEYLEPTPLGRAEWVRAFGLLLGREDAARELFNGIASRYAAARSSLQQNGLGPQVFFGSSWKGTWSVPAGNSYMAHLIADAGGRYLFADRPATGNVDLGLEAVLTTGARAQRWGRILELDRPVTKADVAGDDRRVLDLPVFADTGVFYGNSAESDLFGQAALEPDAVLKDLIGIFRPAMAMGRKPVYFKPLQ